MLLHGVGACGGAERGAHCVCIAPGQAPESTDRYAGLLRVLHGESLHHFEATSIGCFAGAETLATRHDVNLPFFSYQKVNGDLSGAGDINHLNDNHEVVIKETLSET
jgi:hypothetical protein